jgi:hypothetical protein
MLTGTIYPASATASGNLATFATIRRASPLVSIFASDRRPGSSS